MHAHERDERDDDGVGRVARVGVIVVGSGEGRQDTDAWDGGRQRDNDVAQATDDLDDGLVELADGQVAGAAALLLRVGANLLGCGLQVLGDERDFVDGVDDLLGCLVDGGSERAERAVGAVGGGWGSVAAGGSELGDVGESGGGRDGEGGAGALERGGDDDFDVRGVVEEGG